MHSGRTTEKVIVSEKYPEHSAKFAPYKKSRFYTPKIDSGHPFGKKIVAVTAPGTSDKARKILEVSR